MNNIIFLLLFCLITNYIYAQDFNSYINIDKKDEDKQYIRKLWEKDLGIDIWKPYFLLEQFEDWITNKFKLKIFNMTGKLELSKIPKTINYRFKRKI